MNTNSTSLEHSPSYTAQKPSAPRSLFDTFTHLYDQRQDVLLLIRQLTQMIKAAQRHRGMSMGLLGGNTHFREELLSLQEQLERRLELFISFSIKTQGLLSPRDQENLQSAWITISHDWHEDSVIDNYELHCHLIEQLLALLATLAKQLEQPIASLMSSNNEPTIIQPNGASYPNRFKQLEVLHFATRLIPSVAEQIGRIRALATYTAALGICDASHASKLRYVIQCTKVNNEKLRHQSKRMETILEKDSPLLSQLKSYEIKLTFLLNMVEQDILTEEIITADSSRLFEIATDIIDMYLHIVDEGVRLLEQWHKDEIDVWITT